MPRLLPYLLNLLYLTAWLLLAPWLLLRKKAMRGLKAKWLGQVGPFANASGSEVVWFHGVSVGEIHLLRQVVAKFRAALSRLAVRRLHDDQHRLRRSP